MQKILIKKLNILFILVLSIAFIHLYINNTASLTHAEAEVLDSNTTSAFTLSSDRSLTVSVSSANIDLALTPTAEGIFNSTSETPLTVTVSTNNATGYNLNMTTTTTDLTRTASLSGHYPVINTLSGSGSFTSETFEDNAWGYSLDGDNFTAMKLATQINQTTKEANSSATNIIFGAKLNNEIPHGSYRSTITFIATTNPLDATFDTAFDAAGKTQVSYNGNNYYKMQDMSGFICNMVATPTDKTSAESTQLIDIRDNSIYWVSKLLDGRCWMTQNLDLNLGSATLDSTNTDIHVNDVTNGVAGYTIANGVATWTPTNNTIDSTGYGAITTCTTQNSASTGCSGQTNTGFASGWTNNNDAPYSADPGFRYVVPKEMSAANTNWWDNGDTYYNCASQDTLCGGNSANGHYTMGNFYNFAAATATNSVAGTVGHTVTDSDANYQMPNSICPKGWRLAEERTTGNEFDTLLGASNYNVTSSFNYAELNAIRSNPLYFVRSGGINDGTLNTAGVGSYVWSGTISTASYGYDLHFSSTAIIPADSSNRLYGFPVRCVARTDQTIEDAVYLQDVTPEMRQNTAEGTVATLYDKRDGQDYTIAKLADGNIWMTKNLNLAGGTTITPADSNIAADFTLPDSAIGADDGSKVDGFVYNSGSTDCTNATGCYSYYTFNAATAGTGSTLSAGESSEYDICPKGWKLPSGPYGATTDNDFYSLAVLYGLKAGSLYENPDEDPTFSSLAGPGTVPNFQYSGYMYHATLGGINTYGQYMTSTYLWTNGEGNRANGSLLFSNSTIDSDYGTYSGISIRCILK